MPSDEPPCLVAALAYARRGWPVFTCKPRSKQPATKNGVKDATVELDRIAYMFRRNPQANVAIACGAPGPQGLDIDDLVKGHDVLVLVEALNGPEAATARGRTLYLRGSENGTIQLAYGELRGLGSYVIAPPSIHPTGKEYTWLKSPSSDPLPAVPVGIVPAGAGTAGTGEMVTAELIPFGQRHAALKDFAIRQLRAGITDVATLELLIRSYFAARCVPAPPPRPDEFISIATWAAKTHIADRERAFADFEEKSAPKRPKRGKTGLEKPPRGDAALAEHRAFVTTAGGWGDRIDVEQVKRYGNRGLDPLTIRLSNSQLIEFEKQDDVMSRGKWARTVTLSTNGIAKPVLMTEPEAAAVLRSLCILADAPTIVTEAESVEGLLREFCAAAEKWREHDLSTPDGRYDAIRRCQARGEWDVRKGEEEPPVVLIDQADTRQHVRAGEVLAWFNAGGLKLSVTQLAGRMGLVGAERWWCRGREAPRPDNSGQRVPKKMVLYRLPTDWDEPGEPA